MTNGCSFSDPSMLQASNKVTRSLGTLLPVASEFLNANVPSGMACQYKTVSPALKMFRGS